MSFRSGGDELKKYCGKYLVSLESSRLVELINDADDSLHKEWLLQVILMHADQPLIDEVFGELKPSNDLLRRCCKKCRLGLHASKIHLPSQQN